ncbi:Histone-arginine methyltransferase CARM1 [Toxocara canis]|uniref:type I protein arginine methyltransferase n=1 Tax=Toxocara canis TaxID=6265 RepID=A0A0B2W4I8_TOXCA|nr:Histone-arginine methyltransferase CARM1 [Toxocara canis]
MHDCPLYPHEAAEPKARSGSQIQTEHSRLPCAMNIRSYGRACVVHLCDDGDGLECQKKSTVIVGISADNIHVSLLSECDGVVLKSFAISALNVMVMGTRTVGLQLQRGGVMAETTTLLNFADSKGMSEFVTALHLCQSLKRPAEDGPFLNASSSDISVFDARTEHASASQYFQFYGYLSQQQNMMQDYVRTSTYQRAIHVNSKDFRDKVVMDVGAGSGILSFFAIQAGARKVYAVEASSMAVQCAELVRNNGLSDKIMVVAGRVEDVSIPEKVDVIISEPMGYMLELVRNNGLSDKIMVVAGRVEDVSIPEKVDVIISEPMGYMLVNERMLESYINSRKFLKDGGRMFPSVGELHLALFSDEALFIEQSSKANFWCQDSFHGVNLSSLRPQALVEIFKQPIVDTWHVNTLMSGSVKWSINFEKDPESMLHKIDIPYELTATRAGHVHGLAFWFDVAFIGCTETVWLSTAPTEPLTHWYQVRCLYDKPLMVFAGQTVRGNVSMLANERQSYDVEIYGEVGSMRASNSLDLKNPLFRYNGAAVMMPAGCTNESPSDALLQHPGINQMDMPVEGMVNGIAGAYNGVALMGATNAVAQQLAAVTNHVIPSAPSTNTDIIDILAHSHSQVLHGTH